ncbi:phosphatase PAP2 family protein [Bacillus xiapuensis]|uniref:phosphatase PAP2 family protein n=1 Tax=Bacillus xiapuensis TaxID=2014075 RepID=UPI001E28A1BD|nr:phosphatase PAP2 family protein [Bacillus xiapuensis]
MYNVFWHSRKKGANKKLNAEEKKRTAGYYAVLAILLLMFTWMFAEIVDSLKEKDVIQFDLAIIKEVQSWIHEGRTERMIFITNLGSVRGFTIGTIIVAGILLVRRRVDYAIFFVLNVVIGAGLFNLTLKEIFKRQRPEILPLIEQGGYSFPSGHSMGSFIFFGGVAFLLFELLRNQWAKIIGACSAVIFVLLIGLTRIYLGVHYPSDVIGGYIAGAAWLIFSIAAFHFYLDHFKKGRKI